MRRARTSPVLCVLAAVGLGTGACDALPVRPNLERMIDQARYDPYEASPFFADGQVMRPPPEGVVAHDAPDPSLERALVGGEYVDRPPLPMTRALLLRGRSRFDIHCAPCHGVTGDGDSMVARRMELRLPPALTGPSARTLETGRVFEIVSGGYGLMRSYSAELSVEDRWAVAAYLEALRLSRAARLDDLPPALRDRARSELP